MTAHIILTLNQIKGAPLPPEKDILKIIVMQSQAHLETLGASNPNKTGDMRS